MLPLGNFLLRPAAVPVERDGVPIQPRRLCPFASLDFTEREMPAQMPIEKAVARIAVSHVDRKGAGRVELATLVTDMGEAMRTVYVVRVRGQGLLDLFARATASCPSSDSVKTARGSYLLSTTWVACPVAACSVTRKPRPGISTP
jgi:hypothetical protein